MSRTRRTSRSGKTDCRDGKPNRNLYNDGHDPYESQNRVFRNMRRARVNTSNVSTRAARAEAGYDSKYSTRKGMGQSWAASSWVKFQMDRMNSENS